MNGLLFSAGIEEKFITLSLSVLDIEKQTLAITLAGHLPVMIRASMARSRRLARKSPDFPWGSFPTPITSRPRSKSIPVTWSRYFPTASPTLRSVREELYDSREKRRLLKRLAATPGGPEAVGRAILQDIREFSAGHEASR